MSRGGIFEICGDDMKTTLGDIFEIGSGGTPSKAHPEYYGGEIPWVKTGDLKEEYLFSVEDCITEEGLKNSSAKMYEPGTVLIAMYGATIGATSILKFDACTNQACAAFKPCKDVKPEYLYYFLRSKTLKEKMLDAPLIIHGFVNDEPKCNYERYMTELLNCSDFFMDKTGGEKLCWIEKQDHGECDATTSSYSIDYKLLATKSSLQAKRETSGSITKMADGWIAFGIGRLPEGEKFTYIRTAAALRNYSLEELNKIPVDSKDFVEKNVSVILKNVRTKKNLLLFYPYIMSFSEPHTFKDGCKSIEDRNLRTMT